MVTLLQIVVGMIAGAIGHRVLYDRLGSLGKYTGERAKEASGVIISLPVCTWIFLDLGELNNPVKRYAISLLLGFLAVGSGATLATAFEERNGH